MGAINERMGSSQASQKAEDTITITIRYFRGQSLQVNDNPLDPLSTPRLTRVRATTQTNLTGLLSVCCSVLPRHSFPAKIITHHRFYYSMATPQLTPG